MPSGLAKSYVIGIRYGWAGHPITMTLNRRIVQIIIHIAAWGCFLMLPLVFFPRPVDAAVLPEQALSLFFVLSNFFYIAFYYLNAYVLIPKLLAEKRVLAYICIIILLMIFFGVFPRLYHYFFGDIQRFTSAYRPSRPRNFKPALLSPGSIAIFLLVFAFSTGIKVISQWFQTERKNKEIQHEKTQTELSFLKAQINPHFLFNTLNNIYSLAVDRSDRTAAAVMKLSSIMRYVLTEAKYDQVPLEKEIQFTSHYIQLQSMRLTDKTQVEFTVSGTPEGKQITPLLFLPFIENAFKYGVSTREHSAIKIRLEIEPDNILFEVSNSKYINHMLKSADNTGIGIENTRRRLDLMYPEHSHLEIQDAANTYQIKLKIQI